MKKITLLVSQYNSGEWIEQKLNNIIESSVINDIEVICINANSPDPRDDEIPQKFSPYVKYIKLPERIGIYAAWNIGIKESSGQYIANANTDDLVAPHCYGSLANVLDNHPKSGVTYCSWYTMGPNITRWSEISPTTKADGQPGTYAGNFDTGQVGHFPLWRRSIHDQIGYFVEDLPSLGDAEFWARTWFKTQWRFEWLRAPLGAYRWRDGQNAWHAYMSDDQWPKLNALIAKYKSESDRN